MIHSNPSNSTPIFLSARETPDGKLAYDLLYQVRNPSIVTLSHNESPGPRTRHSRGVYVSKHLTLFRIRNALDNLGLLAPGSRRLTRWEFRTHRSVGGTEKIRIRVRAGDGCPRISFATSVTLMSIARVGPNRAPGSASGVWLCQKLHWRQRHEERQA